MASGMKWVTLNKKFNESKLCNFGKFQSDRKNNPCESRKSGLTA